MHWTKIHLFINHLLWQISQLVLWNKTDITNCVFQNCVNFASPVHATMSVHLIVLDLISANSVNKVNTSDFIISSCVLEFHISWSKNILFSNFFSNSLNFCYFVWEYNYALKDNFIFFTYERLKIRWNTRLWTEKQHLLPQVNPVIMYNLCLCQFHFSELTIFPAVFDNTCGIFCTNNIVKCTYLNTKLGWSTKCHPYR